jgi:hypothetical protein
MPEAWTLEATANLLGEFALSNRAFCQWKSFSRQIVKWQKIRYQSIVDTIVQLFISQASVVMACGRRLRLVVDVRYAGQDDLGLSCAVESRAQYDERCGTIPRCF